MAKKSVKEKISIDNFNIDAISSFKLLCISFSLELDKCIKINFSEKMMEIKELIGRWNKRYLTPLRKITIVKMFLLAKLNHLFTCLRNQADVYVKEINNLLFKFVWSSKPEKIKIQTTMLNKILGGLK